VTQLPLDALVAQRDSDTERAPREYEVRLPAPTGRRWREALDEGSVFYVPRSASRTLTPTPLPMGEGLKQSSLLPWGEGWRFAIQNATIFVVAASNIVEDRRGRVRMSFRSAVALLALLIPLSGWTQVIPVPDVQLFVYQNTAGQLIATVAGNVPACGLVATSADPTYTIAGNVITVKQSVIAVTCTNPPPPDGYYVASVNFGRLFDGDYTVNWDVPALSAQYTISGNPGISAAFSGNWFDPSQSGQGFEIEILGDSAAPQMSVLWFTFAPGGGQTWIAAGGPVDGRRATLVAYQIGGPGARFPPHFDASHATPQPWGTLTFEFSDCNSGRVDWASTQPGYGAGTMPLTRLTLPDGLSCP